MTHAVSDGAIVARTSRSAALDRNDDVLAARRALTVVVSAPERSRRGDGQSSRTGARMPIGTRRGGHHDARSFRRRDRRTHDEGGGARLQRRRARGAARARRRRVGPWEEPARRWGSAAASRTRVTPAEFCGGHDDSRGFRRHDRRTHVEVGGARSRRRRAHGSARARRRRVGSWEEPARRWGKAAAALNAGDVDGIRGVMNRGYRRRRRRTHEEVGGARSRQRRARGAALARRRHVGS